jgi:hypothetical protein
VILGYKYRLGGWLGGYLWWVSGWIGRVLAGFQVGWLEGSWLGGFRVVGR